MPETPEPTKPVSTEAADSWGAVKAAAQASPDPTVMPFQEDGVSIEPPPADYRSDPASGVEPPEASRRSDPANPHVPEEPAVPEPPKEPEAPTEPTEPTTPPVAPVEPTEPTPPPSDPRVDALMTELYGLRQELAAQRAEAAPKPEEEIPAPAYNIGIPPEMIQSINSTDPAEQARGFKQMADGLAALVQTETTKALLPILKRELENFRNSVIQETGQAHTKQTIERDFYSTYPQFNTPELRPVVSKAATMVPGVSADTWSPAIRDQIAEKAKELLRNAAGVAAPAPASTVTPSGKVLPMQRRPAVSPSRQTPLSGQAKHIADVMEGGY